MKTATIVVCMLLGAGPFCRAEGDLTLHYSIETEGLSKAFDGKTDTQWVMSKRGYPSQKFPYVLMLRTPLGEPKVVVTIRRLRCVGPVDEDAIDRVRGTGVDAKLRIVPWRGGGDSAFDGVPTAKQIE